MGGEPRSRRRHALSVAVALCIAGVVCAQSPEPWSDPALPVREGLQVWLDATRVPQSVLAIDGIVVADGDAIGAWYDASGRRRDVRQAEPARKPRFFEASPGAAGAPCALRFDGLDDVLSIHGVGETLGDCTVVAACVPFSNTGGFRALLAFHREAQNDYRTGLTLDLGPDATNALGTINVEGIGFEGARDLATGASRPFGELCIVVTTCRPGNGGVELHLDGAPAGSRDRAESVLQLDGLHVGARFYSNTHVPPAPTGFLDGALGEVLVYDRALAGEERAAVEEYLGRKYSGLAESLGALRSRDPLEPLVPVPDPPALQMLLPGFRVRRLPLDLPNVNNVRYREDGKLVALAYDGRVFVCADTDGDGLEDRAEIFWDRPGIVAPVGMALTPPDHARGRGVFVACKGKVALLVDTDRDEIGDREIVVAEGWPQIEHNVDALGVAVDRDGNVYFGIGTTDYTNPYLVDDAGKTAFDLDGERGTIQRVSADFSGRETVCTGIRFPVALAIDREGELFATDQEGATWLADGNPFDELLHVQRGRHYGFPPRHPRHLPNVIDEPSVAEYGPQHQSACGLVFDEPGLWGPSFGPESWRGDALVCGYSRGKLYRTELVRGAAGYVARTTLLACASRLLVDAAIAPGGELVVAAHGGGPDWGSGPSGKGDLYEVAYSDRATPQPLFAAPVSPNEVRISFDRPLDVLDVFRIADRVDVTAGAHVSAGDRFESLRPGYRVVSEQLAAPRHDVRVHSVSVSASRRTLVLDLEPRRAAWPHAATIRDFPRSQRASASDAAPDDVPQVHDLDLAWDDSGAHATWTDDSGEELWSGWLPHLDLAVARELTEGSADHANLWSVLAKPGTLRVRARLDLRDLLRPAVQPGSTLDHTRPAERASLRFESSAALSIRAPGAEHAEEWSGEREVQTLTFAEPASAWVPIELEVRTRDAALELAVSFSTNEDPRPRALPLSRIHVPWSRPAADTADADVEPSIALPPGLAGGDWLEGRRVFQSTDARCASCHSVDGVGGAIGPDLSNLRERDPASVVRDVRSPSYSIHPDHISHLVVMGDGTLLTGTVRTDGDELIVGNTDGVEQRVPSADVERLVPQSASIMPEGLAEALGPERLADLLAFLVLPLPDDLAPAPLVRADAPPGRTRAEVERVLGPPRAPGPDEPRPLRLVLVAGEKDHGADEHDYPLWQRRWTSLLSLAKGVDVGTAWGWPAKEDFATADVLIWNSANPSWTAERGPELDRFLAQGGGLVYVHYAVNGRASVPELAERIGLAWRDGESRYRHGELELRFEDAEHPITRGLESIALHDESYWALVGDPSHVHVLASAVEEGVARPLVWTREQGRGRVFVSIPGHYTWTFDDPLFRVLLLRAIAWCAGEDADRFVDLAGIGARWRDQR